MIAPGAAYPHALINLIRTLALIGLSFLRPLADVLMLDAPVIRWPRPYDLQMADLDMIGLIHFAPRRFQLVPEVDVGIGSIIAPIAILVRL